MIIDKNLFMCPPNFLEFEYVINPWMKEDTNYDKELAMRQWTELYNLYLSLVPDHINSVKPKEGLLELCFFGDSVFTYKNKAVFSRFATEERYDETAYVIEKITELGFEGHRVPEDVLYEGSGETLLWKNKILVGYGQRSNGKIKNYLAETLDAEVIGLKLIDPKYYHLDTALFPVSDNLIAYYKDAFSEDSIHILENLDCELLEVSKESAESFALNSIALNDHIIVHYEAKKFIKRLKDRGFIVKTVDVSEFIKFGGGLKCLTFQQY